MTSPLRKKLLITASEVRRKTSHNGTRYARFLVASVLSLASIAMLAPTPVVAQQKHPQKFYRPKRYTPPVHAKPGDNAYVPPQYVLPNRQPARNGTARPQQRTARPYPVRQASRLQDFAPQQQTGNQSDDQWRTRTNELVQQATQDAEQYLRHSSSQGQPAFQETAPQTQQNGTWDDNRFSDVAVPDNEIPATEDNLANRQNYSIPAPRRSSVISNDVIPQQSFDQNNTPSIDRAPAIEDYANNSGMLEKPASIEPQQAQHPLRDNEFGTAQSRESEGNQLRDLRVEPQKINSGSGLRGGNAYQTRYRRSQSRYQEDSLSINSDDETRKPNQKSCEDYRTELLNSPITEIVLDISPMRPSTAAQQSNIGLTRTWTDCEGNQLATGTLTGMERSYVVITNESGASQQISMSRLSDSDLTVVTQYWALPNECSLGCYPFEGRHWMPNSFFWKASALCHNPLYFENRQLERYGHTHGPVVQPFQSTAHFFTNLLLWPYNSGINPPNECLYALGFYRPGDCAPWLKDPFPISTQGAVRQGMFIGAGSVIFP